MTPSKWYADFLESRQLDYPNAQPLYAYKVSETEFLQLQKVLKFSPINHTNYQKWNTCFVLYAAEWWRRFYTEGHWSWEPIFDSIQRKLDQPAQRSRLVESGFKGWRRKVHISQNGSKDYLATVVIESGLPLQRLAADKRGWLQQLIRACYADLSVMKAAELEPEEIVQGIAEQQQLPVSLQKPGFYVLIAQIVQEAIALKRKFNLGEQALPTEFLDHHKPSWRDSFPIQIDAPVGKQFLGDLLTDVAKLSDPKDYPIAMIRELIPINDAWKVKTILSIPNGFYGEAELRLMPNTIEAMPLKLDIELRSSLGDSLHIGYAYRTQKQAKVCYRISDLATFTLNYAQAFKNWSLFLIQHEKQFSHELPLPGGEALDRELPWVFVESKTGVWQLKSMASYRTRSKHAKILAPTVWSKTGNIEKLSPFDEERDLYLAQGVATLYSEDQIYRIATNDPSSEDASYDLHGAPFRYASKGQAVFLGFPSLFKFQSTTLSRTRQIRKIEIKRPGQNSWEHYRQGLIGAMSIRLLGDNSEVLFTKRICVLPANFDITLESISPNEGAIVTVNSSDFHVSLLGDALEGSIERTSQGHRIKVKSLQHIPPKDVTLSLVDSNGSRILAEVPFPSTGAKFFDTKGNQLPNGSKQYFEKLYGLRLALFNPTGRQRTSNLIFELIDSSMQNIRMVKSVKFSSYHYEISVSGFLDTIRKLFASTERLDSVVRFSVEHGPSITIQRYISKVVVSPDTEYVTIVGAPDELENTVIHTFRLDEDISSQKIESLEPITAEDIPQGTWRFNITNRLSGKWLLFPGKESSIMFRPKLWIVLEEEETAIDETQSLTFIRESAQIKDRDQRINALTDLALRMSNDFNNSNWRELQQLWTQTDHLPLNTFDVWTAFAQNDEAIVSLFLQMPNSMIERFVGEYPILLETIPVQIWVSATQTCHDYWLTQLPVHAKDILESKLQFLENEFSLSSLARLIRSEVLGIESPELRLVANAEWVKELVNTHLNGGLGYQGLNHRTSHDRWPIHLNDQVSDLVKSLPSQFEELLPKNIMSHTRSVVYLPFLLAAATVKQQTLRIQTKDFNTIYRIKETQDFDRDWFNAVYDLIQCYYWMN